VRGRNCGTTFGPPSIDDFLGGAVVAVGVRYDGPLRWLFVIGLITLFAGTMDEKPPTPLV
jgi:hypothetical protein